jgi:hypothetical protein
LASALTRAQIRPTVRRAIRINTQIAVFDVLTVNHATVSSKLRVNPASWRAHGTAATTSHRQAAHERADDQRPQRIRSQQTLAVPLREQLRDERCGRFADLRNLDPQ